MANRLGSSPKEIAKSVIALALIGLSFVVAAEIARRLDPT